MTAPTLAARPDYELLPLELGEPGSIGLPREDPAPKCPVTGTEQCTNDPQLQKGCSGC